MDDNRYVARDIMAERCVRSHVRSPEVSEGIRVEQALEKLFDGVGAEIDQWEGARLRARQLGFEIQA